MTEEERRRLKLNLIEKEIIASQSCEDDFIEDVKRAFTSNIYPGDENLVSSAEHRVECEECREAYNRIVGKFWQESSNNKYFGGLDFFKPLAWHYYLPAYLIQCVRRKIFSSIYFLPTVESDFENYEEFIRYYNDWEQSRIDLLSPEQCKAIVTYLEIVLKVNEDLDDDTTALSFWKETHRKIISSK